MTCGEYLSRVGESGDPSVAKDMPVYVAAVYGTTEASSYRADPVRYASPFTCLVDAVSGTMMAERWDAPTRSGTVVASQ